jgi:hypothetical protein
MNGPDSWDGDVLSIAEKANLPSSRTTICRDYRCAFLDEECLQTIAATNVVEALGQLSPDLTAYLKWLPMS